jgi:hypothetical protein
VKQRKKREGLRKKGEGREKGKEKNGGDDVIQRVFDKRHGFKGSNVFTRS